MLLVIDNYDSFTYNLVDYFRQLGEEVRVFYHDALDLADISAQRPDYLLLSPGPGAPNDAGICLAAIHHFGGKIPMLGVCLGHQAIAQAFGAKIVAAKYLMHGKTSSIYHHQHGVFQHLPSPFKATRYHSLAVAKDTLKEPLLVTAWADDGEIMGIRHRDLAIEGIQFHPESILSQHGQQILGNFLQRYRRTPSP